MAFGANPVGHVATQRPAEKSGVPLLASHVRQLATSGPSQLAHDASQDAHVPVDVGYMPAAQLSMHTSPLRSGRTQSRLHATHACPSPAVHVRQSKLSQATHCWPNDVMMARLPAGQASTQRLPARTAPDVQSALPNGVSGLLHAGLEHQSKHATSAARGFEPRGSIRRVDALVVTRTAAALARSIARVALPRGAVGVLPVGAAMRAAVRVGLKDGVHRYGTRGVDARMGDTRGAVGATRAGAAAARAVAWMAHARLVRVVAVAAR